MLLGPNKKTSSLVNMLKRSLKHSLLRHHRLTFTTVQTLFQRLQSFHHFSLCDESVRQTLCYQQIHVPLKLSTGHKRCLCYHHTRQFHCGTLGKCSDKTNANKTINNISAEFVKIDDCAKGPDGHTINQRRRDIAVYMDNIAGEVTDLERSSSEVGVPTPDREIPKIYKPQSIISSILEDNKPRKKRKNRNSDNSDIVEMSRSDQLKLVESGELVVNNVKKVEFPTTVALHEIVNECEVLQELVKLGVDLPNLQKKGMVDTVMKMDPIKDMAPYLCFLQDNGVHIDHVGTLINRCPWIFQHPLHNLQVRVDYLRSKKFKTEHISNMLERDPKFLLVSVNKIDARLGFIQKLFNLTGDQIRNKVGGYSKLIIAPSLVLEQNMLVLEAEFGFTKEQLKTIFLAYPKTFHRNSNALVPSFQYVHDVMDIPLDLIAQTARVMSTPKSKIENRHRFLVKCGRDQYEPMKENYVSLMSLISIPDEEWCFQIAKSSIAQYNTFLKMI